MESRSWQINGNFARCQERIHSNVKNGFLIGQNEFEVPLFSNQKRCAMYICKLKNNFESGFQNQIRLE